MPNAETLFSGVKDYRDKLLRHASKKYTSRPYTDIKYIAVHHSLTTSGSAESFARYHVNTNNWPGIGYHYVIEKNGVIKWCNSISAKSYHVGNSNRYAIGICLTGDFRTQELEKNQLDSLLKIITALMKEYGIEAGNVQGHNQFPGYAWKKCPCIDMENIRSLLRPKKKTVKKLVKVEKEDTNETKSSYSFLPYLLNPNKFLMQPGETIFSLSNRIGLFDPGEIKSKNKTIPPYKPVDKPEPIKVKGPSEQIPQKLKAMLAVMNRKGYKVFSNDSKPYNLNLVGVRKSKGAVNRFDDELWMFWKYNNTWELKTFNITTDPGLTYLQKPINEYGTAILKEGNYKGAYQLGKHRGKYEALVQAKPVTVIRDFDRDSTLDYNSGKEQTGLFGINIHRASSNGESTLVNKWSAGCQVFANGNQYKEFIKICRLARDSWGNAYTYSLINSGDFQ